MAANLRLPTGNGSKCVSLDWTLCFAKTTGPCMEMVFASNIAQSSPPRNISNFSHVNRRFGIGLCANRRHPSMERRCNGRNVLFSHVRLRHNHI